MSLIRSRAWSSLRVLGPAAMAATLAAGALPAFAQPAPTPPGPATSGDCSSIRFELANPSPGSRVEVGGLVLEGLAMDERAQSGPGIDRIDFFLGSREEGGINIGSAIPGGGTAPLGPDSFQTTVNVPDLIGGHDLFAYAHSMATSDESVISVPIVVGEDPSKAGETSASGATPTMTEMCMTGGGAATTGATTPATTTTTTTTPATTTPATTTTTTTPGASTVTFEVANPSPGDTIHVGGYAIEGRAMDRDARSGSGIDRVEIFLDNRDEGGMFLSQASFGQNDMWHAVIDIPSNQTGLHTLFFYAHSMANDQETVVSVPVTVAP